MDDSKPVFVSNAHNPRGGLMTSYLAWDV